MKFMKHPTLGNAHFDDAEEAMREGEGWVTWPRTAAQKVAAAPDHRAPSSPPVEPAQTVAAAPKRKYTKRK